MSLMSDAPQIRVDAKGEPLRLMAVHAHPDDESSKGAATMAKYVAEGVQVLVVTATGGERGDILNPAMDTPENQANIPALRQAEMAKAREILGVEQRVAGLCRLGPARGRPAAAAAGGLLRAGRPGGGRRPPWPRIIRAFRRTCSSPTTRTAATRTPTTSAPTRSRCAGVEIAADPLAPASLGEPWQVLEGLLPPELPPRAGVALDAVMHEHGLESPVPGAAGELARGSHPGRAADDVHPGGDYFEVRDDALRAHATQVDPNGFWFAVPLALQRKAWPTEDYQLAQSHVPSTLPEDDLFAGIPTRTADKVDAWYYTI
jgi:mycothiol S-conjugate amidase